MVTRGIQHLCRAVVAVLLLAATGVTQEAGAKTVSAVFQVPGADDGANPLGQLTELNGTYYGVTSGPADGGGTLYRIDLRSGKETVLYRFSASAGPPLAALVALNGKLYGSTSGGGYIFSFDPSTGIESNIYQLPEGASAGALVAYDGLLYGSGSGCGATGGGCIFSLDPASGNGTLLHSFLKPGGEIPNALTRRGSVFYGTSYNSGGRAISGTIFKFDPATRHLKTLFNFTRSAEGAHPSSGLVDVGGLLYGTTAYGGFPGAGTVFSFDPQSTTETVVYNFSDGDGVNPAGGLLNVNGKLYGTAPSGGFSDNGVVYSIDPASGQESFFHSFSAPGCSNPDGGLIEAHGLLYGVTYVGGVAQDGCIYSIDPATAQFAVVHQFSGPPYDGAAGLTKYGPELYGVAAGGGVFGFGSIYRVHPATGAAETLYSFDGEDGARPSAALTEGAGIFYGTTASGGSANAGTVFSFDPKDRSLTTLYNFPYVSGRGSSSRLAFVGNALFGVTPDFPFEIDLATLRFTRLHPSVAAKNPAPDLTLAGGLLYGVTEYGGTGRGGTIFSIDPANDNGTTVYNFGKHLKDGVRPTSDLTYSNGMLYGLTNATGSPSDIPTTFFQYDPATGTKTTLHVFRHAMPTNLALTPAGDDLLGAAYVTQDGSSYAAIMRLDTATGTATFGAVGQLGVYPPVTPLVHTAHGFYFDTQAPCVTCTAPTAGTLYKLAP